MDKKNNYTKDYQEGQKDFIKWCNENNLCPEEQNDDLTICLEDWNEKVRAVYNMKIVETTDSKEAEDTTRE